VYTSAGGGTAVNPAPGDTLNLNSYQVTVNNTNYSFNGAGIFQNAVGSERKGYYHESLGGNPGDWDAADTGPQP
jgi:hypothetical protein